MTAVECWQSCVGIYDWVPLKKLSSRWSVPLSIFSISWLRGLLGSHCASLHGRGDESLEATRASVPKHLGTSSSCYLSKWLPILMSRIRETENLWNLCTATLPRASSIHTFRMALLVGFLRTMAFFFYTKNLKCELLLQFITKSAILKYQSPLWIGMTFPWLAPAL